MSRIARGCAALDLVVTGAMALPPSAALLLEVVYRLSGLAPPPPDPTRAFFVCLAGALGVIWALARLREPRRGLVLSDAVGRVWVAGLIAWFVFAAGAPRALLLFVASELPGAIHQAHALRKEGRPTPIPYTSRPTSEGMQH